MCAFIYQICGELDDLQPLVVKSKEHNLIAPHERGTPYLKKNYARRILSPTEHDKGIVQCYGHV